MLERSQWLAIGLVSGFAYILGKDKESFNAPYAGSGSLMGIKQDTSIGDFSTKELAESSAIHGDFDEASLNYSGHQNIQVRGSESFEAPSGNKFVILGSKYIEDVGIVTEGSPYLKNYYGEMDEYTIYDDDAAEEIMSIPVNDARLPLKDGEIELIKAMVYGYEHPRINDSWGELNEDGMFWTTKVMETLANYDPSEAESFGAETYKVVLRKPNEFRDFPYIIKVGVKADKEKKELGIGPYGDTSMKTMKTGNARGVMYDESNGRWRLITNEDLQELSKSEKELFMETYFDSINKKLNKIRRIINDEMGAESDGITRDEKGMRHSPHKKCPDCGAKPTSSWIDPGKCECGRVMNPSEYTNIRFSAFGADEDNFTEIENLLDSNDDIFLGTGDGFKPDHPNREEIIAYLTQGGGGQTPYRVCFTCSRVTPDWVTIDEGYECFPCADQ